MAQGVELAAISLPGASVGLYTQVADGSVLTLAASAGVALEEERVLSSDEDETAIFVRGDADERLGELVVEGVDLEPEDVTFLHRLADVLSACISRNAREEELLRRETRLVEAQRISQVGSYDFEIATNTNLWSDQLFRIYGREPQSFNATYERFLELIHPDDREHVMAVHQRSLATLEPFEMEERIIWPDGDVRTLASWGEVVADADGTPTRMMGICWDITERRALEEQLVREALHDQLTGLPNRALFVDRLTQALESLPRKGRRHRRPVHRRRSLQGHQRQPGARRRRRRTP